jgi:hypothetical protein
MQAASRREALRDSNGSGGMSTTMAPSGMTAPSLARRAIGLYRAKIRVGFAPCVTFARCR